ncbi:MAG: hypothetical protein JXR03_19045 [Cyclobacteriaceae bacterium]
MNRRAFKRAFLLASAIFWCIRVYSGLPQQIGLIDKNEFFTLEEVERIDSMCEKIQKDHNLSVLIHLHENEIDNPRSFLYQGQKQKFVLFAIESKNQNLSVFSENVSSERKAYFEMVGYQWITTNLINDNTYAGIIGALNEINGNLETSEGKRANANSVVLERSNGEVIVIHEIDDDGSEFTFKTRIVLKILLWIVGLGVVYYTVRSALPGNSYQNTQFYAFSRVRIWVLVLVGVILVPILGLFFYRHIYYYEELAVVLIVTAFAFIPILGIAMAIVMFVIDIYIAVKTSITASKKYTLAQKALIHKRGTTGEHLLELNFYELLIRNVVKLEYVLQDHTYHQRLTIFISKSSKVNMSDFERDHQPYIAAFTKERMMLEEYLMELYYQVISFKAYKKDWVGVELLRKGDVSGFMWVFNLFGSSKKKKEIIKDKVQQLDILVQRVLSDEVNLKLLESCLNKNTLLVPNYDEKIDSLYNKFTLAGQEEFLKHSELSPLFIEGFDFDHFNNLLAKSYKMSSSSWGFDGGD